MKWYYAIALGLHLLVLFAWPAPRPDEMAIGHHYLEVSLEMLPPGPASVHPAPAPASSEVAMVAEVPTPAPVADQDTASLAENLSPPPASETPSQPASHSSADSARPGSAPGSGNPAGGGGGEESGVFFQFGGRNYELVAVDGGIDYAHAKAAAKARGGYLAIRLPTDGAVNIMLGHLVASDPKYYHPLNDDDQFLRRSNATLRRTMGLDTYIGPWIDQNEFFNNEYVSIIFVLVFTEPLGQGRSAGVTPRGLAMLTGAGPPYLASSVAKWRADYLAASYLVEYDGAPPKRSRP